MTASLQSGKSRLKMYVYERIPDLLTTNLENISQRRMTMEIRYIERKKVRLKSSLLFSKLCIRFALLCRGLNYNKFYVPIVAIFAA